MSSTTVTKMKMTAAWRDFIAAYLVWRNSRSSRA
jgi:hypothetical protein